MHALVRRLAGQVVAHAAPERGDQRVPLVAVHLPHSADVSCEVSLFHEGGDDCLAKGRWLAVHEIARGAEGLEKALVWGSKVKYPARLKEALGARRGPGRRIGIHWRSRLRRSSRLTL